MTIAESLARASLFAHVPAAQRELLASAVARVELAAGAPILRQGEATRDAYWIEAGAVAIERSTPYGAFRLARLGPGELFGEASFVDGLARSGDALADQPTTLLVFRHAELGRAIEEDNRLGMAIYWALWKSLSTKLRTTNAKLVAFFSHGVAPTIPRRAPQPQPASPFHVDLATKRGLFAEQKLSSLEINFLSTLSKERQLAPGEVIFREGDEGDAMFVVLEGRVRISKFIPGAGEEALAFLERGDYFGEMALIDAAPRSADARAHDAGAVVLAIPKEVVEGLLDMRKVSSLRLLLILCALVAKRLREIDEKLLGWFILSGGAGRS